jgi:hypothetical protein
MSIVTCLTDFENLLVIAKRHNLSEFKVGDIHIVMPPPAPEKESLEFVNATPRSPDEIDAEIYNTSISI